MKDLMTKRPMLALLIVSVTAAVVSAWLLNPNIGPAALLGSATAGAFVLKLTTIVLIIAMGASLTYIVMRVAIGPEAFGLVEAGPAYTPGRRIAVQGRGVAQRQRTANEALDELESMIGLGSVKNEVNKLLASLEIEKKRREQGLPVAPTSRHMVFTGPPGVGKTVVAGVLGDIYRSLGVLRKGHFVPVDRSDLVAGYVGQTATKTLEICKSALDGILFIDEAYSLVQQSGASWDFGREAIDTLLKFMEDNRERIIVIAAGYPNDMRRFVAANQGLQSRFTKTIDFPAFSTDELLTILRSMAGKAGYQLPDDSLVQVRSWIESRRKDEAWGNARSVRTLLEAAREAQAVRISGDPSADLVRIEPDDIEAAIAAQA
jgi:SpoVK/Ycf46/Vps4 family AAA+-type ATPase